MFNTIIWTNGTPLKSPQLTVTQNITNISFHITHACPLPSKKTSGRYVIKSGHIFNHLSDSTQTHTPVTPRQLSGTDFSGRSPASHLRATEASSVADVTGTGSQSTSGGARSGRLQPARCLLLSHFRSSLRERIVVMLSGRCSRFLDLD